MGLSHKDFMNNQKKKDKFWWIHPKFKAKQSLTFSDMDIIDEKSYDSVKSFKNLNDQERESTFPVGGGKYKDFAKVLYKMNNYKTGIVAGWFVVICIEEKKKWAVAQLKADPNRPLLVFEDLIFNNESDAMTKAAELRISDPGPTRLPGEIPTGNPENRKETDSLELKRKFDLKLAGIR